MQILWKQGLFVGKGWLLIPALKRYLGEDNRCGFCIFKKQNFHFLFEMSLAFEIHINI